LGKEPINVHILFALKGEASNKVRDSIAKAFDALNELGRVAVVLDEAQYLRYSTVGLRPLLAHVYDRLSITLSSTMTPSSSKPLLRNCLDLSSSKGLSSMVSPYLP